MTSLYFAYLECFPKFEISKSRFYPPLLIRKSLNCFILTTFDPRTLCLLSFIKKIKQKSMHQKAYGVRFDIIPIFGTFFVRNVYTLRKIKLKENLIINNFVYYSQKYLCEPYYPSWWRHFEPIIINYHVSVRTPINFEI